MTGFFNPEGWQSVAGGRSGAQTPGWQLGGSVHPGGMPEFCDPSGVGGRLLDLRPGGVAALDPRLQSSKPSACPGSDRESNHRLQARPGFAWLFVLRPRPGLPEPDRSAQLHAVDRSSDPG